MVVTELQIWLIKALLLEIEISVIVNFEDQILPTLCKLSPALPKEP